MPFSTATSISLGLEVAAALLAVLGVLAAAAPEPVQSRVGDAAADDQHDDEDRRQVARLGERARRRSRATARSRSPRVSSGRPGLAALAPLLAQRDRLLFGGTGLLEAAQLLGALGRRR